MAQLFKNNAASILAAELNELGTALTVASGEGALFPSISGGDHFLLTLYHFDGPVEADHEIVKVTARTDDAMTIERGEETTLPRTWPAGTRVELRLTAGTVYRVDQASGVHNARTDNPHAVTKAQVGLGSVTDALQLIASENLNDVPNKPTARTNLGLGSAAVQAASYFALAGHTHTPAEVGLTDVVDALQLIAAENLNDVPNKATARSNLGLGSAAVQAASYFALASHSHAIDDVTDLQANLNAKASISHNHDAFYLKLAGGTLTGTVDTSYGTSVTISSGGSHAVSWSTRNVAYVEFATGSAVTLTFTAPAGSAATAILRIHANFTSLPAVTWPATVRWPGGTTPTFEVGKRYQLVFAYDRPASLYHGSVLGPYD